jgi:uncharacterized sulfatase
MLTGLYPHQHGIYFNHPPNRQNRHTADYLIRRVPTLPRVLSEAGYHTLQTGKHWEGDYANAGFDEGMTLGKAHPIEQEPPFKNLGMRSAHGNGDAGLVIGRRTMQPIYDFINASVQADAPFFVWYAPFLPHVPYNAAPRYLDLYRRSPQLSPSHVAYYANITWFDDTVGELIRFLEARDLSSNTLVIFVIDNGWIPSDDKPGQHVRSKNTPYEAGLRTPILIGWDGQVVPQAHDGLVSSIDLVPTLLAAAGIPYSGDPALPGINLLPAARGESSLPDRAVFGEIYSGLARSLEKAESEVLHRWVRSGDYKLILSTDPASKPMLFNVVEDPNERQDLAHDPDALETLVKLTNLLDNWWNLEEADPGR